MSLEGEGMHLITPTTAGDIKKSSYAMLNGHPCKIMDISKSKTGKHGHAKCNITGVCAVTGKKIIDVQPAHAAMYAAEVTKTDYQLIGINDGVADLLDENNNPYTVSATGELAEEALKGYNPDDSDKDFIVSVLTAPKIDGNKVSKIEMIVAGKFTDAK